MNTREKSAPPITEGSTLGSTSELLILPDGKILVHNLTPAFAAVLSGLNSADEQIQPRAALAGIMNGSRL
jgi:hypothetical protein